MKPVFVRQPHGPFQVFNVLTSVVFAQPDFFAPQQYLAIIFAKSVFLMGARDFWVLSFYCQGVNIAEAKNNQTGQ